MGNVRSLLVKRTARKLVNQFGHRFRKDYTHNKQVVGELLDLPSKRMRNLIAGYVTRLVRSGE